MDEFSSPSHHFPHIQFFSKRYVILVWFARVIFEFPFYGRTNWYGSIFIRFIRGSNRLSYRVEIAAKV